MRWNIGPSTSTPLTQPDTPPLPFSHPPIASSSRSPPPTCPMSNTASTTSLIPPPAKCPIDYEKSSPTGFNPLNSIPLGVSATTRAVNQVLDLPTDRETSTIPRPKSPIPDAEDEGPTWEYPSPQQFYNALVRKGWETPEESIEMVVQIHNFLNEMAWEEVMKWERRLPG